MLEGEVLHHVLPQHSQPQLEERDLHQLPTQKGKVVRQDMSQFLFFNSGTEVLSMLDILTSLYIPDDFGQSPHET